MINKYIVFALPLFSFGALGQIFVETGSGYKLSHYGKNDVSIGHFFTVNEPIRVDSLGAFSQLDSPNLTVSIFNSDGVVAYTELDSNSYFLNNFFFNDFDLGVVLNQGDYVVVVSGYEVNGDNFARFNGKDLPPQYENTLVSFTGESARHSFSDFNFLNNSNWSYSNHPLMAGNFIMTPIPESSNFMLIFGSLMLGLGVLRAIKHNQ